MPTNHAARFDSTDLRKPCRHPHRFADLGHVPSDLAGMSIRDGRSMKTLFRAAWAAFASSFALLCFAQGGAPTPAQQQLRAIYRELVEINTTDSVGSCTAAAEAMAARLKAGGLPAQDVQ